MTKTKAAQSIITLGMGTEMIHSAFGKHAEKSLKEITYETSRLEKLLSCFVPESDISRINNSAGIKCEKLSPDTYEVLSLAVRFSRLCNGLFDITIGPLVNLWDYKNSCVIPEETKIRQILTLVNYTDLMLEPGKKAAGLKKAGQSIDLGGIGKGYASDKFLEVFRNFGVKSAFTNIGGNVAVLGTKPDGSSWSIGIRHPREENRLIGAVLAKDQAVVTSGDYQRYFIDKTGKRRHHILDPATGYPSESGLISVTIVTDSGTTADALSTILFVTGLDKGLKILKSFPGTEAILIDNDLTVYVTYGLKDRFQPIQGIDVNIIA